VLDRADRISCRLCDRAELAARDRIVIHDEHRDFAEHGLEDSSLRVRRQPLSIYFMPPSTRGPDALLRPDRPHRARHHPVPRAPEFARAWRAPDAITRAPVRPPARRV